MPALNPAARSRDSTRVSRPVKHDKQGIICLLAQTSRHSFIHMSSIICIFASRCLPHTRLTGHQCLVLLESCSYMLNF